MNKFLPKFMRFHSLFSELMTWVSLTLILLSVLLGMYIYDHVNKVIEQQYLSALESLADEKASSIYNILEKDRSNVRVLSHIPEVHEALLGLKKAFYRGGVNGRTYQEKQDHYDVYFQHFLEGSYYDLFLIDRKGTIVYTVQHESDLGKNLLKGAYKNTGLAQVFRQSLKNLEVVNSTFAYYESSQEPALFITAPMIVKHQVVGVVGLQVNTQNFYHEVNNYVGLGKTGMVVVGKRVGDHVLLASPLRHDPDAAFQRTIPLNASFSRPIRESSQGKTGKAILKDGRGHDVLAVWQYIPALQWGMVVKIDTSEAFSYWQELRKTLMFYIFMGLLLLGLVVFLAMYRITKPLQRLTEASVAIASGKDDVAWPSLAYRNNELSVLSQSFQTMTQQLQASKQALLKTVQALDENNQLLDSRVHEQTAKVRAVLDATSDGMVTVDALGVIQRVNPALCRMFEYVEDDLIGSSFTRLFEDSEKMNLSHDLLAYSAIEQGLNRHVRGVKKTEVLFNIELNINAMQVDQQNLFLATLHDVSERTTMQLQQDRLTEAIYQSKDAVLITDRDGVIEYFNPAFQRLSGYSEEELLGRNPRIMNSGKMSKDFYQRMWDTLMRGDMWHAEFTNCHKDGTLYEVDQTISPILDQDTHIVGFTSVQRDITGEKEEREKLEHIQRLESLGVLAGGIAHDFNNLLTAILGNAALAKQRVDHLSPVTPLLTNVELASEKAAALCKQMLAYSGKGEFITEKINLTHMIQEMMSLLNVSIDKNIVVRLDLSEQLMPIEADVAQMQQVVMNLVINASEAIGKHSGTITLHTGVVDIDQQYITTTYIDSDLNPGRYVALEVSDTGCGMNDETKKHLFDPFFTTKFTGRGLGMSAILGIIRGHHGGIKVYSELGKGSTFKVLLPCLDAADADMDDANQDSMDAALVIKGCGTILVIDDEETIRTTASMMLESFGFKTLTAQDGEVGVAVFREHQKEINGVLLDMTMPRMNGEDCFRELRRIDPHVVVILSSGYNQQDATNRFAGKGLAGFIQKPYFPQALGDMMMEALAKHDQEV
ncbi:MAG: PAS domain S-box protein [Zetaproteobacteria bacterium]|nr:PAS domain S-box protein [Zetaproteobacteria bacterium]